jgi:ubiquinone/menaquinone biosynthesis C-methylase UbiE
VSTEERRIHQDYQRRYRLSDQGAAVEVERLVLGTDFGASGYTTRSLADQLSDRLNLSSGEKLLDLGTGCGWPGLRIAIEQACKVIGCDLPLDGLARAMDRARRERAGKEFSAVRCSARHLPFRKRSFDVIVHTDVLC